MIIKDPTTP